MIKPIAKSLLLVLLLCLINCDEDSRFEGIVLRDASGQPLGVKGSSDLDDWGQDDTLPSKISTLMNDIDLGDLSGTAETTVSIVAYPNPCADQAFISFNLHGGSCGVKVLLVNDNFKVLRQATFVGEGQTVTFNVSKLSNGSVVRAYYSVSSSSQENFFVGHGDILISR